jgi:hypothetical protein
LVGAFRFGFSHGGFLFSLPLLLLGLVAFVLFSFKNYTGRTSVIGGQEMRGLILAAASIVFFVVSAARADNEKDATYYCAPQITSGVAYDERGKRWIASTFKPTEKFVLKLQFLNEKRQAESGPGWAYYEYNVWVTREGESTPTSCKTINSAKPEIVRGTEVLRCDAVLFELTFNMNTNRFLTAYLYGYVNGKDNNDDTPAVSVGICTKIK